MAYPPFGQQARAQKIGHVVVNTVVDRPWSQYFCCLPAARRDFVRRNPVATKRAMRAFVKAYQICASEPERAARFLVDKGYATHYDYALQALKEMVYTKWREYDPENTLNFYALRMREAGLIKSTPKKIIADGTDWRFLNELKKELKG
jgi:NitT/TauT family transport system substrate-binding protein